ncbi:MAG: hypothetical protein WCN88_00085 [Candidatus Falkowbacteria bacterium]
MPKINDIPNLENIPKFIKDFSKEESKDERYQAAVDIRAKRSEYFNEEKIEKARQVESEKEGNERRRLLSEQLEKIYNLKNEITELSESGLKKILNYFELKKIRAEIVIGKKTYEELNDQFNKNNAIESLVSQKTEEEILLPWQTTKIMLDNFYQEQEKKWANSEYAREDVIKYFSEKNLAALSLEEYTLLLKRFSGEMVTHVTRQGVRDHVGHSYHTAGEGEFSEGFSKMIEDGRLRSPLGVRLIENEKEKALAKFLSLDNFNTKEEALAHLSAITNTSQDSGSYMDSMAVHFAAEEVADDYYGSEKGNEIFIAYPSLYIASQYYFRGFLDDNSGGYWNDSWVWANEEKGIDLNTGIIFIPEEAKVDRQTGSRYELDEDRKPIKNQEYYELIRKVVNSEDFYDFAGQVIEITGYCSGFFESHWDTSSLTLEDELVIKKLDPFLKKLEQEFNITDKRLQQAIMRYDNLTNFVQERKNREMGIKEKEFYSFDYYINKALKQQGILFSETKDDLSSKEFWENKFRANSKTKPSKIVYYHGIDATNALNKWREENEIIKKKASHDMGFPEKHINTNEPPAISGIDRFQTLAEKVIEDYFNKKEVVE